MNLAALCVCGDAACPAAPPAQATDPHTYLDPDQAEDDNDTEGPCQ